MDAVEKAIIGNTISDYDLPTSYLINHLTINKLILFIF